MENFQSLNLPAALMKSLEQMQFTTPTPIQAQAIPLGLEGRDVLGTAQTGTGKTAAFGIPLITKLLLNPRGSALVMTPTRELAVQVMDTLKKLLGRNLAIKTALLIGGESMPKQFQELKQRPRLIVGTPGRINDHLERGSLMLHDTNFLVLDETDRMLDMGFGIQIDRIVKFLPQQRQTLLFSATLPDNILSIANRYQRDAVRISVGSATATADNITQEVIHTTEAEKYDALINQLTTRQGSVIIFVKTKWGADKLAARLTRQNHSADAIHGNLKQNKRDKVIAAFRNKVHRIMVATDIAARGLDIPHIEHVINYDLPQCPEDYIHRIGRTARAGADGASICLVTPEDGKKWVAIQRMLNPGAKIDMPPRAPRAAGAGGGRNYAGADKKRRSGGGGGGNGGGEKRGGENRGNGGAKRPFRFKRKEKSSESRPAAA